MVLGGLSAASAGAGAIASHQAAQAQTAAQNRAIANRKNQENALYSLETLQGVSEYNAAKLGIKRDQNNVGRDYQDYKSQELLALDDAISKYFVEDTNAQAKIMAIKKANEGGRAKTYDRNPVNELRRERALLQSNLGRRKIATYSNLRNAKRKADEQRYQLYLSVANPYRIGPAPSQEVEFLEGPSPFGLVAGLTGAAVSGASTYNSFAPEGQKLGDIF